MTGKIKYSIIIPCYNEELYISNILKSLELTEYDERKFEVIVSLNNCKDRTEEVVSNYKSISKMNIKVVYESTPGVSYARNCGAKNAIGEYFIFLDADNIAQKSFFIDIDVFTSDANFSVATIKTMPDRVSLRGYLFFSLLEWVKVTFKKPFGKSIIRNDIFKAIDGFDTSIKLGENIDVLLKAKKESKCHNGVYQHLNNSIYCSLRRFDDEGYFKIAMPWLIAYLGVKTLDYKTYSEIEREYVKSDNLVFNSLLFQYCYSYILYPILEKIEKRNILSKLKCFLGFENALGQHRDDIVKNKLYTILKDAGEYVPYYKKLFQELNFSPEDVLQDVTNINKLPYLTKDIIHKEGVNLLDIRYKNELLHKRKTGGSSGASSVIYYSQEALDWSSASHLHVMSWTGKKRYMKEIHLSTKFPESLPLRDRIKNNIKCKALNRTNITTHSFDDVDMEQILKKIKTVNAYCLEGHPSTLYALSLYIKKNNITFSKPLVSVFESTGEVLDKKKRESIEKYIGCTVYNRYGNAEFGVIAHDINDYSHSLKVIDNMVYPELFDCKYDDNNHRLVFDDGLISLAPTLKMINIWKNSKDLQSSFPYALTTQAQEFWAWWLLRANIEYNIENIFPIDLINKNLDKNSLLNFLIEVIWKNRVDLQSTFPSPHIDTTLIDWWYDFGIKEFFDFEHLDKSELVLTTLTNNAMPLIRYRTGDLVERLEKKSNGYFITNIEGRIHDLITIGNKSYPTHYIQDLLDRLGDIVEFQIENIGKNKIKLYVVAPNKEEHRIIKSKIKDWWKDSVDVCFIEIHQLKKVGWRDKFRYVIS